MSDETQAVTFSGRAKDFIKRLPAIIKGSVKSWTMRFNVLVGTVLLAAPIIQDSLPQLQAYLTPEQYKQLAGFLVIANILLRVKTNKALDQK